jgi:hypothetical protein
MTRPEPALYGADSTGQASEERPDRSGAWTNLHPFRPGAVAAMGVAGLSQSRMVLLWAKTTITRRWPGPLLLWSLGSRSPGQIRCGVHGKNASFAKHRVHDDIGSHRRRPPIQVQWCLVTAEGSSVR